MANKTESNSIKDVLAQSIKDILELLPQDREREIISRRFGLFDRKETLEQIGDMLGITRERVRQLEKAILIKLKMAVEGDNIQSIKTLIKISSATCRKMVASAVLMQLRRVYLAPIQAVKKFRKLHLFLSCHQN